MASSSNSPCAACKFLRRKCTSECVFAPYFPPDQPQKFANVHKIFGASNVTKLLNELAAHQREDAVSSLAYEAEARVQDPVYGCIRTLSNLNIEVNRLRQELHLARQEISRYISAGIGLGQVQPPSSSLCRGIGASRPSPRERHLLMREQQIFQEFAKQERQGIRQHQVTREQLIDFARLQNTGSYETALTSLGFGAVTVFPSNRGDGAAGGAAAGRVGRLSSP